MKKLTLGIMLGLFVLPGVASARWNNLSSLKVAVLDFTVNEQIVDPVAITEYFTGQLVNMDPFTIVERSLLQRVLREQEMDVSGLTDQDISRIGRLVGADKLISGSIAKLGNNFIITIKGIDVTTAKIDFSDQAVVPNEDAVLQAIADMAARLIRKANGETLPEYRYGETTTTGRQNTTGTTRSTTTTTIRSAGTVGSSQLVVDVQRMLMNKYFLNPSGMAQMSQVSSQLDYGTKMLLFNQYKKSVGLGIGLNLLVCSLGSWVIGDYLGAVLQDLTLATGVLFTANWDFLGTGIVLIASAYVLGVITPIIYAGSYNNKLRLGLNMAYGGPVYGDRVAVNRSAPSRDELRFQNLVYINVVRLQF